MQILLHTRIWLCTNEFQAILLGSNNEVKMKEDFLEFYTSDGKYRIVIQEDKKAKLGNHKKFVAVAVLLKDHEPVVKSDDSSFLLTPGASKGTEYKRGPFEIGVLVEDLLSSEFIKESDVEKITNWSPK
jgi:hypothetical protein